MIYKFKPEYILVYFKIYSYQVQILIQLVIHADITNICPSLNSKFENSNQVADFKIELQSVVNRDKKGFVKFNASK